MRLMATRICRSTTDHIKNRKKQYPQTVVIPVYKPSGSFLAFLKDLRKIFSNIIIINDGSGKEYDSVFIKAQSLSDIVVLHHYINLGKGRALKTAFNYCLSPNTQADHGVITVDADGQHNISDIIKVAQALEKNPEKMILGCRCFDSSAIPFRSRFGNKLSKVIYKWLCGISVSDTQTGLRGIPFSFLAACCQIEGERYEYETNMLLTSKEYHMSIIEVPIETIYENGNAASHFNPFIDSLKIYAAIIKYSLSSILSVIIDYFLFSFLVKQGLQILLATYIARVCCAVVNFSINRNVVFKYKGNFIVQLFKYILLIFLSGTLSGVCVWLISGGLNLPVVAVKAFIEIILYFMNFYIQRTYVFIQ